MTPSPSLSATSSPTSSHPASSPTTTTFEPSSRPPFVPLTLPPISGIEGRPQYLSQQHFHEQFGGPSRSPSVPAPSLSSAQGRLRHGKYRSDDSIAASSSDTPHMAAEDNQGEHEQSGDSEKPRVALKKKRTRTLTTPQQSAVLHALLQQSRFPTTAMREEVGRSIGLSARKVQVWFQNQRQKARKPRTASTSSAGVTPSTDISRSSHYGSYAGTPQTDTNPEAGPSGSHGMEHSRRTSGTLPELPPGAPPPRGLPAPFIPPLQHPPEGPASQYSEFSRPYSSGMGALHLGSSSGSSGFFPGSGPPPQPYYSSRSTMPFSSEPYAQHSSSSAMSHGEPPIQLPPLRMEPVNFPPHAHRPPPLRTSTSIPSLSTLEISSPTAPSGSESRSVLPPPITLQPAPQWDWDRRLPPSLGGPSERPRTTSDPNIPPLELREGRPLLTQPWPLLGNTPGLPPPPNVAGRMYDPAHALPSREEPDNPHGGETVYRGLRRSSHDLSGSSGSGWQHEEQTRRSPHSASPHGESSQGPPRR